MKTVNAKILQSCQQLALSSVLLACAGCAAIITSGDRNVRVASEPPGASIKVYDLNDNNIMIASVVSPTTIKLKKGSGYFKGADYKLVLEKDGYTPREFEIHHKINGWYFGNFFLGGLLGLLVVDPLTGGMWVLEPDELKADLQACPPAKASLENHQLNIIARDQLSPEQQKRLVPVSAKASTQ